MRRPVLVLVATATLGLAVLSKAAWSQQLSIVRQGGHEFLIEALVPPNTRYCLQASGNLGLWLNVDDEVQGPCSISVDSEGVGTRFFRLVPWTMPLPPVKIVLLGDSTVADFETNSRFFNGWGQGMYSYFNSEARIVNLAVPGYTTRLFLTSAEKTQMELIRPDYVLIQLGLIDEYAKPPHNTSLTEYAENLRSIVRVIREFGGVPILVTPPALRFFDAQQKVIPVYQERWAVMRSVAAELEAHLIDLNQLSMDLLNRLGKSGSDYIWWGSEWQHFSDQGAKVLAGLVVSALPEALGPYLVSELNPARKLSD